MTSLPVENHIDPTFDFVRLESKPILRGEFLNELPEASFTALETVGGMAAGHFSPKPTLLRGRGLGGRALSGGHPMEPCRKPSASGAAFEEALHEPVAQTAASAAA
jgi:hypothetical protein